MVRKLKKRKKKSVVAAKDVLTPEVSAEKVTPASGKKLRKKKRKVSSEFVADTVEADLPVKRRKKKKPAAAETEEPVAAEDSDSEGEKEIRPKMAKKKCIAANAEEGEVEKKVNPLKKLDPYKVCVSQLPWHLDEDTIRKDFSECGAISACVLLTTWRDGFLNSRGIAFISFEDEEGRQAALKYNGTDYGGRLIKVNPALEREDRLSWQTANPSNAKSQSKGKGKDKGAGKGKGKPRAPLGPKPEHCTSILVKSLSSKITEDDIQQFFKECGKQGGPTNVRIIQSSAGKRLAFVDFDDTNAVDQAIKLNGTDWNGEPAHLDYSKPRAHKIRTSEADW